MSGMQPGIPDIAWLIAAIVIAPIALLAAAIFEAIQRRRGRR